MNNSLLRTNEELVFIYNHHVNTVYKVCFMYLKNSYDAENIVQDTFIKLMESSVTFENVEHEKAWLIRTASNLCKNQLRHWWKKTVNIDDVNELAFEQSFDTDETINKIMSLPLKYKSAIYLFYYENYSTAEIAKILKLNESTVRGHLHKGRKLLKIVLEVNDYE